MIFGEQSLLLPYQPTRIAAIATADVECYASRASDLQQRFADDPDLTKRFFNHVALRLAAILRNCRRPKKDDTQQVTFSSIFRLSSPETPKQGTTTTTAATYLSRDKQLHVSESNVTLTRVGRTEFECYWQRKEYEMMGRAFITEHYVCFESTLFGFPSREAIPLSSIKELERSLDEARITSDYKSVCCTQRRSRRRKTRPRSWGIDTNLLGYQINFRCHEVADTVAAVEAIQRAIDANTTVADPPAASWQIDEQTDPLNLTRADWDSILDGAKQITFKKGSTIILEGESYQRMYQVVKGSVRIEVRVARMCTLFARSID